MRLLLLALLLLTGCVHGHPLDAERRPAVDGAESIEAGCITHAVCYPKPLPAHWPQTDDMLESPQLMQCGEDFEGAAPHTCVLRAKASTTLADPCVADTRISLVLSPLDELDSFENAPHRLATLSRSAAYDDPVLLVHRFDPRELVRPASPPRPFSFIVHTPPMGCESLEWRITLSCSVCDGDAPTQWRPKRHLLLRGPSASAINQNEGETQGTTSTAAAEGSPLPPAVVSGPYLQAVGPTSALVVWRTSTPDEGRVTASTQRHSGLLTFHQASPPDAASLDVIVALTGLHPHTTYAYRMWGTAGELLPGQEFQFTTLWGPSDSQTAPVPDTAAQPPPSPSALASLPVRLLLLGDVGTGTGSTIVPAVLSAAASFAAKTLTAPSALVLLGDQGYEHGADSAYTLNLFQPLQSLLATTPMFPVPGNRDGLRSAILRHGQETGPYFTRFFAPREGESGGLASHSGVYYAVDVGALHLIVLDSVFSDRSAGGAMANWLRADLAALNGTQWLVAVWHHPPYSKGGTDSDFDRTAIEMRETFLPLLEAAGVDVIVSGHAHNYERSVLIDGAYGSSDEFGDGNVVDAGLGAPPDVPYVKPPGLVAHKGCVAVVAGSAGDINYKNYGMMHPTHLRLAGGAGRPALLKMHGLLEAGSFFIDVDPENSTLTGTFVTANGDVGDRFAIVKRAGAQEATRAQLASVSASSRGQLQRAQSLVPVATGAWSESLWLVILLAIAVQFVWSLFLAKRRKGAKVEPPVDEPV